MATLAMGCTYYGYTYCGYPRYGFTYCGYTYQWLYFPMAILTNCYTYDGYTHYG